MAEQFQLPYFADDAPAVLASTHQAVLNVAAPATTEEEPVSLQPYTPTVTARKSFTSKDYIISITPALPNRNDPSI